MSTVSTDPHFMARAIALAARGLYGTDPNPRVGCVLVRDGEVVGEGWHARAGEAHAEINALRMAGERARGATAYVSLEPCSHHGRTPPCADALVEAGVARVVAAMQDPNPLVAGNGLRRLAEAGVEVHAGVCEQDAQALNPGFVRRMRDGRPLLRCKMAMSLDGRTAMGSGESKWITGAEARADVHRLRARSSAVLTGIGTVLADDPSMNARLPVGEVTGFLRQPLRVVLDTQLRMPPTARLLEVEGETLVLTACEDPARIEALRARGAEVEQLGVRGNRLDLHAVLALLSAREINEVLLEAGAALAGAAAQAGLIDQWVLYVAPHLMGSDARGLVQLPGVEHMRDRLDMRIDDVRMVGPDLRILARPGNRTDGATW